MARRYRRSYRGMVKIPGLGFLNQQANTKDIVIGGLVGLLGTGAVRFLAGKVPGNIVPTFVLQASPLVGGLITGGALYALQRKKNPARAKAHFAGAAIAGASVTAWGLLQANLPGYFSDVVSLNLSRYGSVFVDEPTPGLAGLLVDEPSRAMSDYNLGQLASMSMHEDDDSGIESLMDE